MSVTKRLRWPGDDTNAFDTSSGLDVELPRRNG